MFLKAKGFELRNNLVLRPWGKFDAIDTHFDENQALPVHSHEVTKPKLKLQAVVLNKDFPFFEMENETAWALFESKLGHGCIYTSILSHCAVGANFG